MPVQTDAKLNKAKCLLINQLICEIQGYWAACAAKKMDFNGGHPLMEDDIWSKITFDGRQPFIEDFHWWKRIFCGRRPKLQDDTWAKTAFNRRNFKIALCQFTNQKVKKWSKEWQRYLQCENI